MRWFCLRVGRFVTMLVRRLLASQPANPYEDIMFNAVRTAARQFGQGRKPVHE